MLPTITIISINLNGLDHLKKCLPSLINQSYPQKLVEIIIVDNGSTDQSVPFLEQNYPNIKIIKNSKNEGFAKANNQAAAMATGEYLALINNDMVAENDWLEQLVMTKENTGVECIAGTILNWDGSLIDFVDAGKDKFGGCTQINYKASVSKLSEYSYEKELIFACGGAMLVNKSVFLTVGGFDEDFFAYYEDADLGWRLWVLGYKIVSSPKAISYHYHHGTSKRFSKAKRLFHINLNALCMIYKNYDETNYLKFTCGTILLRFIRIAESLRLDLNMFHFNSPNTKKNKLSKFKSLIRLFLKMDRILLHLAIVGNFVIQLSGLKEKRKKIQANRVRSDAEILQIASKSSNENYFKTEKYCNCFDEVFKNWDI